MAELTAFRPAQSRQIETSAPQRAARASLLGLLRWVLPRRKSADEHLAAQSRREAARRAADRLL